MSVVQRGELIDLDIERLRDTYRIDAVQPMDMFPHTPHVETVVRLTKDES